MFKLTNYCHNAPGVHKSDRVHHSGGLQHPYYCIKVAYMSQKGHAPGYKDTNQDAVWAYDTFAVGSQCLFGVCDGHGAEGHKVSSFIKQHLPRSFFNHLLGGCSPQAALGSAFQDVDAAMMSGLKQPQPHVPFNSAHSGSTAVVCFLQGSSLTTAWVGDSRAVLGRPAPAGTLLGSSSSSSSASDSPAAASGPPPVSWSVQELSFDHKPDRRDERQRILKSGGRVMQAGGRNGDGPYRVWLRDQDYPGLAMSRAMGDHIVRDAGVICTPEFTRVTLPVPPPHRGLPAGHKGPATSSGPPATAASSPPGCFLVMASDGVWEFMSNEEVVDLVGNSLDWEEGVGKGSVHDGSNNGSNIKGSNSSGRGQGSASSWVQFKGGEGRSEVAGGADERGDGAGGGVMRACRRVMQESTQRWQAEYGGAYVDDITVLVAQMQPR